MSAIDLTIVHVRDEVARTCRVGLVLDAALPDRTRMYPELRLRVIRPSGLGPVGIEDDEGVYRHTSERIEVDGANGPRLLDSWHRIGSCIFGAGSSFAGVPLDRIDDEPAGAGHAVEAGRG